jgi:hypothetical protein
MERIRIERKPVKRKIRPEVLPLDPRDPDIVRAKRLLERERQERRHSVS